MVIVDGATASLEHLVHSPPIILELHLCYVTHSPANEVVVNPQCHYFIIVK